MTDVRSQLLEQLNLIERVVAGPLMEIPASRIDEDRSVVRTTGNDVVCKIWSVDDSSCPFELMFDPFRRERAYSWFIGMGAEIFNYESIDTPELSATDAARYLLLFLESKVRCELVERAVDGHLVSATYTMDRLDTNDGTRWAGKGGRGGGFLRRKRRRVIEYTPWIDRSTVP